MKISAVAVTSKNIKETLKFYTLLGFKFGEVTDADDHIEPEENNGARLMIDKKEFIEKMLGKTPAPASHSSFAIEYESPAKVDEIFADIKAAGYKTVKDPWDAFWGQRYAIVADPDGYEIDIYAYL